MPLEIPFMQQAINKYYEIIASDKFHEINRLRAKALHDEASALADAERKGERKGKIEGVVNMVTELKISIEDAMRVMRLPEKEKKHVIAALNQT